MSPSATHRAIDAVWRIESARLIAGLARIVRDVAVAEDLAQDALVAALEQWPVSGIPDTPGAWLMATAKRRGIDALRRRVTLERKRELIGRELEILQRLDQPDLAAQVEDVQDEVLRLIFMTCHPVLSVEARVALTLRLLGGLSTPEIARAFLVSEGTVAQRIVRAKRTLAEARVPFEAPARDELTERVSVVLEVIYLVFNEGYAASAGEHWVRPALCADALRLGRILAALLPREPEVHGLLALMELQASRLRARVGRTGSRCCWPIRTARAGTICSCSVAWPGCGGPRSSTARWDHTRCRPRSPPATRGLGASRQPTGRGSWRSTTGWRRSPAPQWWSSTARWR
ncbi:MAG TPA: sigma-70 family RNA polymerase sigma factor [Solirubrobacteraceae bacterium]|nr:sigma-70 family RNA polymerase sigma factor [Solirubrobacteraceae bacterium]